MTKKYAVLGSPIEHSLSPKIHQYIFERLGKDDSYERFELSSGLEQFLDSKDDYAGFSLTMPLKGLAFVASESVSLSAQMTGSVNTLLRTPTGWAGFNTDVHGIQAAIAFQPETVAVLGSGATARSALFAFPNSKKLLSARSASVAESTAAEMGAELVDFEEAIDAEVVVSTLPSGVLGSLLPTGFKFKTLLDAAYMNPAFPAQNYVSGLEMLLQQALGQQRIFRKASEQEPLPDELGLVNGLRALLNVAK